MAWLYWNSWQAGVITALGGLLVFIGVAAVAFWRVRDLSWRSVALPYVVGMAYTLLPDAVPLLPADDMLMTGIMGLLSYVLALRKNPAAPKWPLIPLLGATVYPLLGSAVPLPIDELVVQFLLGSLALKGAREHWTPRHLTATRSIRRPSIEA
jgi:hypothetical protein